MVNEKQQVSRRSPTDILRRLGYPVYEGPALRVADEYVPAPYTHILSGVTDLADAKRRLKSIGAKHTRLYHYDRRPRSYGRSVMFRLEADADELREIAEKERLEAERKARVEELDKAIAEAATRAGIDVGSPFTPVCPDMFMRGALDLAKLDSYFQAPEEAANKDEMRIRDIIIKSVLPYATRNCVFLTNYSKMRKLAIQMNGKILDELKRFYRAEACRKYGLLGLANIFAPKTEA